MSYSKELFEIKMGLRPKTTGAKPKKPLKKVSDKKKKEIEEEKELRGGDDTDLVRWFKQKIKYSTGHCSECNCKVEKNIYQYAVMTVAHLLPKRDNMCPSVKTHPQNFIILCPDHHRMFDNSNWEEKEMMGCWSIVRDRLVMVYPDLAQDERRHFPESVLRFIEKNEPF